MGTTLEKRLPLVSCFNLCVSFAPKRTMHHDKIKMSHTHKVINMPCMRVSAARSGMIARLQLFSGEYDLEVSCQPCLAICFVHSAPKASSLVIKGKLL
jgi:hypothetical protein